ncbi:hypothetical protein LSAT2_033071 [Lamellibrachia satsuma]|nr:hypothetical protein LSAT2_033071 [Lamellibrachia satsuma]
MDTYLTALRHNFVRRAWVNWKGLRSDQFFSPLLRQCFKRCYRCLSPATEEMVFVRAPSAPKPYSMGQFSHVNTDYSNVLSKPIRIPKFDRGPPPCPQSIVPATPWSRGPIPPRRPRTCIPKHSGTPCPLSITPVTRCARAPTPPCRPGSCFMRPPATPIEALSS